MIGHEKGLALDDEALRQVCGGADYSVLLHPLETFEKLSKPFVALGKMMKKAFVDDVHHYDD